MSFWFVAVVEISSKTSLFNPPPPHRPSTYGHSRSVYSTVIYTYTYTYILYISWKAIRNFAIRWARNRFLWFPMPWDHPPESRHRRHLFLALALVEECEYTHELFWRLFTRFMPRFVLHGAFYSWKKCFERSPMVSNAFQRAFVGVNCFWLYKWSTNVSIHTSFSVGCETVIYLVLFFMVA